MGEYKIYYFGNNKITWNNSNDIGYIFERFIIDSTPIDVFSEKFKSILDDAVNNQKTNYLIFCEDLTKDYCDKASEILLKNTDLSRKIFINVTIYNKTTNAHLSIQRVSSFKKIVNIFPFDRAIQVCDESIYERFTLINKTITVEFNPTAPADKVTLPP